MSLDWYQKNGIAREHGMYMFCFGLSLATVRGAGHVECASHTPIDAQTERACSATRVARCHHWINRLTNPCLFLFVRDTRAIRNITEMPGT